MLSRPRLASVLVGLWCAVQATAIFVAYPRRPLIPWGLFAIFLAMSIVLWLEKSWARASFLAVGGGLLIFYAAVLASNGLSCNSGDCYAWKLSQPILLTGAFVALIVPTGASNDRSGRAGR
jgi:hypothetical protein